jgi:Arf-GAP/coiled-coil/ANK repeat/PH domain-containing protein
LVKERQSIFFDPLNLRKQMADSCSVWASINLGLLLCIDCSGVHRSLGVQISKVRSIILDKWELEVAELNLQLGNTRMNAIFEANLRENNLQNTDSRVNRPEPTSSRYQRDNLFLNLNWRISNREIKEKWIAAKYIERRFVWTPHLRGIFGSKGVLLQKAMWDALDKGDIPSVFRYLILGAGVDSNSAEDISRNSNDSLSLQASVKYASQHSVGIKDTEEEFLSAAEDE